MSDKPKPRPELVELARTVWKMAPKGSVFFVGLQFADGQVASMSNLPDGTTQALFLRGFVGSFEAGAAEYEPVDVAPPPGPPLTDREIVAALERSPYPQQVRDFNAHIQECAQCREQPLNPCAAGVALLGGTD
jgi:hypothetical protein